MYEEYNGNNVTTMEYGKLVMHILLSKPSSAHNMPVMHHLPIVFRFYTLTMYQTLLYMESGKVQHFKKNNVVF